MLSKRPRAAVALGLAILAAAPPWLGAGDLVGPPAPLDYAPPGTESAPSPHRSGFTRWRIPLGVVVGASLGGVQAAGDPGQAGSRHFELGAADAAVITASVGLLAVEKIRNREIGPCSWCDQEGDRITLNGVDRAVRDTLRWDNRELAGDLSDILLSGSFLVPATFLAFSDAPHAWADAGLVLEATATTVVVTHLTKKMVRRPRPYALRGDPPPGVDLASAYSRQSFFSGHSSITFALAVASGTIASRRERGNAGFVLGSGLALAATTGYLRIAAERHYLTDVLVGAAVGSVAGYLVPRLHGVKDEGPAAASAGTARGQAASPPPTFALTRPVGESSGLVLQAGLGAGRRQLSLTLVF
jgi:membrane-associated phospholipid phosphatase